MRILCRWPHAPTRLRRRPHRPALGAGRRPSLLKEKRLFLVCEVCHRSESYGKLKPTVLDLVTTPPEARTFKLATKRSIQKIRATAEGLLDKGIETVRVAESWKGALMRRFPRRAVGTRELARSSVELKAEIRDLSPALQNPTSEKAPLLASGRPQSGFAA